MKKLLLETSFNNIYMIVMVLITLLVLGGCFSYAMFTVSKEKKNAITIITGNLEYKLDIDGTEGNKLIVPAGETKEFTITLSNLNNRIARFNFYYEGSLPSGVEVGYVTGSGLNIPPAAVGVNLEKSGSAGSSNIYKIRVKNNSGSSVTVTLGGQVGLDYNDLTLPSNGHLFEESKLEVPVSYIVLENLGENGDTYDDETDTFITGTDPNNYIWYSGKLWRAVSVNNASETTKLVTQWNISTISYNSINNSAFEGSYMEEWLNDTSVDGFLGNLRNPDMFIETDASWDATPDNKAIGSVEKPDGTTTVNDAVGLLNLYEYKASSNGLGTYNISYLNNGLNWWTLTPYSAAYMRGVSSNGSVGNGTSISVNGVRPSIILKSNIKIVGGAGTENNPYRLEGDNDTNLSGTYLKDRFSGEYIRFGNDENNLYRIVSHENEIGTKIVSADALKNGGDFITNPFGNSEIFSATNAIGTFLNGDYLNQYVDSGYSNMIEESTTWYLGTVGSGISYKLAKYTDRTGNTLTSTTATSKVGLLRYGELMAGQFERYMVKGESTSTKLTAAYWTLTPYSSFNQYYIYIDGSSRGNAPTGLLGVKPSLNLKSNVIITSGTGTKSDPFILELG